MLRDKIVLTFAIIWIVASAAHAQAPLQWKLDKGQTIEVERITLQKQSVKTKNTSFKQEIKNTTHFRLVVKEVRDDGYLIEATKTKVESRITRSDENAQPFSLDESLKGMSFTFVVSPQGRLVELQGYEEFLKQFARRVRKDVPALESQDVAKFLRHTYSEDVLKEAFTDLFGPLPGKDRTWERTYVEPISIFGSLRSNAKYADRGNGRIDYTIETKYEPPKDNATGVLRIVKGSIDSEKARGTIAFDPRTGRLVEHDRSMSLRAALTIEAADRQQPLEFSSENEMKIRVK